MASPFCEQQRHPAECNYNPSVHSATQRFGDQIGLQSSQPSHRYPECYEQSFNEMDASSASFDLAMRSQFFGMGSESAQSYSAAWGASTEIVEGQWQQQVPHNDAQTADAFDDSTFASNTSHVHSSASALPQYGWYASEPSFQQTATSAQSASNNFACAPNRPTHPHAACYPPPALPNNDPVPQGTFEPKEPQTKKRRYSRCMCPICKVFAADKTLKPSGKRMHLCHVAGCGKMYANITHLKAHLRRHDDETRYRCDWPRCGKTFAQRDGLQRHAKIHTGDKGYTCPFCDKRFVRTDHLDKHMRMHVYSKRMDIVPQF